METIGTKQTISAELRRRAEAAPNATAYIFDGTSYSWRNVDQTSERLALHLRQNRIGPGELVGIWGVNTIDLIMYFFALQKIGALPVLMNYSNKTEEMRYILNHTELSCLLIGELRPGMDYQAILRDLEPSLEKPLFSLPMDMTASTMEYTDRNIAIAETVGIDGDDEGDDDGAAPACIIFTSGSTDRPKSIVLSHRSLLHDARQVGLRLDLSNEDRQLLCLPIFHCSGLTTGILIGLCVGAATVLHRSFHINAVLNDLEKYRCTIFNVVPSMLSFMLNCEDLKQYDLSSLRGGIAAGSGMSETLYFRARKVLPMYELLSAYGQTETSPLVTMSEYADQPKRKASSVGRALPEIEVRVANEQSGEALPPETHGEIQVRGVCVMNGYYKMPLETKNKFTKDGWLKTGDLGYLDQEGYLYFVGRIGDMIIRGGENISPLEIEQCLARFVPTLSSVKIIGVETGDLQEEVACFVVCDQEVEADAIRSFVAKHMAAYKVPRYVTQIEDMPLTATGKPDQQRLRKLLEGM